MIAISSSSHFWESCVCFLYCLINPEGYSSLFVCVRPCLHIFQILYWILDFSFEKYSSKRLTCTSCFRVLLRVLNILVVEKDWRLFLVFLGHSHFEMFYSHAYLCTRETSVSKHLLSSIGHDVFSQAIKLVE